MGLEPCLQVHECAKLLAIRGEVYMGNCNCNWHKNVVF